MNQAPKAGKRHYFLVPLLVLIIVLLVVLLRSRQTAIGDELLPLEFTTESWRKQGDERYRMIDSLLEQYSFVGMSRSEILDVVGPADWEENSYWLSGDEIAIGIRNYNELFFHRDFIVFKLDGKDICINYYFRETRD